VSDEQKMFYRIETSLTLRGLEISDSPAPRLMWTCKEEKVQ